MLCLRIYSFSWLFVQVQPLFLSERSTYERAFIFQCQSWLEFLSEVLSWCHRMTGTRCVVTLCHLLLFFVFLPQTMNFTLKISSISFGCTKCRCVTCVRLYICGANLHSWCMFLFFLTLVLPFCDYNFFSFFFGLVTKVAVVFLWVLVPLETVFPAKNSNNTCCTRPFRGSEHN